MSSGAWVGAASKQTSTMPDVAVRWLHSLLGALGGDFGWDILYLGVAELDTPIWNFLAPKGEQEEVPNHLRMGSISPGFPIRQVVPLGLAQARFCSWACWALFFMEKQMYYSTYSTSISIPPFSVAPGRPEWMDVFGWSRMTFPFCSTLSYLRYLIYCTYLLSMTATCKNLDRLINFLTAPPFGCKQLFLVRLFLTQAFSLQYYLSLIAFAVIPHRDIVKTSRFCSSDI